jgi:hypothetical protein
MTMTRSGVLRPYLNQKPMQKAPPTRPDVRASESDIRHMTGKSGPANAPGHHHVHYSVHGDHRQGMHTGSANQSKPPVITAGRPAQVFSRNGGDNGV